MATTVNSNRRRRRGVPRRRGVHGVRRIMYGARRVNRHIPVVRRLPLVAYQDDDNTGTDDNSVPPGFSSTHSLTFSYNTLTNFNLGNLFNNGGTGSDDGGTDDGTG
jgi:hypothetical protein